VKIAIVGAGIGGLMAAATLRRDGAEVAVFERAEEGSPLGTGIGLWANALDVLRRAGVADGLTDNADLPDPHTFQSLWSRDAAAMLMPMSGDSVHWFVSLRLPQQATHDLGASDVAWQPLRHVIANTEKQELNRTDLYEARPLRHWVRDRVALLGDAAHAMRPALGMGGCQAIEDAAALAACLRRDPSPAGLHAYENVRRPRADEMWWQSYLMPRLMNPQRPIPNWARDLGLRAIPQKLAAAQFRRMVTPTTLV